MLIVSLIINFGLVAYCCTRVKPKLPPENATTKNTTKDYEIASMKNFENVYLNRNDSIYKQIWNEAFENQPQSAFLISCSYFYVTKDKRILKDIEVSTQQLESVYQRKFLIEGDKIEK